MRDLDAIMREDEMRRIEQDIAAARILKRAEVKRETGLPFVPNHMRQPKASQDCWTMHNGLVKRARGYTGGGEDGPMRPDTMLVTRADGSQSVEPIPTRSRKRNARKAATVAARAPEAATVVSRWSRVGTR